jgi:hypothetical protein
MPQILMNFASSCIFVAAGAVTYRLGIASLCRLAEPRWSRGTYQILGLDEILATGMMDRSGERIFSDRGILINDCAVRGREGRWRQRVDSWMSSTRTAWGSHGLGRGRVNGDCGHREPGAGRDKRG